MYKHILIPTDGSACSEYAIRHGLELARTLQADVTLLYVLHNPVAPILAEPMSVAYGYALVEDLEKAAHQALAQAQQLAQDVGVKAQTSLIEGDAPTEAILKAAEDHDLIVMGPQGRSGMNRLILGSITERVLRQTRKPLLVVHCP